MKRMISVLVLWIAVVPTLASAEPTTVYYSAASEGWMWYVGKDTNPEVGGDRVAPFGMIVGRATAERVTLTIRDAGMPIGAPLMVQAQNPDFRGCVPNGDTVTLGPATPGQKVWIQIAIVGLGDCDGFSRATAGTLTITGLRWED